MAPRHPSPDRYQSSPAHYVAVAMAALATICLAIGIQAGPRDGLIAAAFLLGLPCAGGLVLALLYIAAAAATTALCRRAWRRAGLDDVDPVAVEVQALADLAHRLDQEA
jgi:hypothetical protein